MVLPQLLKCWNIKSWCLEKHPLAVTISLWTTFLLSHHSCSYNTTALCHTITLQKWEFLPFPTSFLCFPLCEQTCPTPPHPISVTRLLTRPSHWMLTPILCCFPAVRSWGGSLLWLLHGENWISWNALVRFCSSKEGGLALRNHRHCEVGRPRRIPRQDTWGIVDEECSHGLSLSTRCCQIFHVF